MHDLRLFCLVARRASFVVAAREAKVSQTLMSKRIAVLEATLGVKLLIRTTRRVQVTDEGLKVMEWARRILDNVEELRDDLILGAGEPSGPIRISSSLRIGREVVAPAMSRLKRRFPGIDVWLELLDRRVDLIGEGFHLDIRAGEVGEPSLIAHRIIASSRILCAAPDYIARQGEPRSVGDLTHHDCVLLRERNEPFGVWRLQGPRGIESVKVGGTLASNDIDIVLEWARDGHGVVMSADWLLAPSLADGTLVRVLPDWHQVAHINAVSSVRSAQSPKVRICIEYLKEQMSERISR